MREFKVDWTENQVQRVLHKVADTPLPPAPLNSGWTYGCDADFLRKLQRRWVDGYDWRFAVETLNRWPQFIAAIDGLDIHFVHVKGESPTPRPLLMTHGWPGSHYEFWKVIEPLAFPSRFGGNKEDAFDLVLPTLPGYGFSGKPPQPLGQRATAKLWNTLMTEVLGYPRYWAQGGDWGGVVTSWLGLDHGAHVQAIHLNMLAFRTTQPPQNEAEGAWMQAAMAAQQTLGPYAALQRMRPQSLAWATADNPLGQAAWIVERFHDWADLGGQEVDALFGMDHLLTNIMLYVMTGSFPTSLWFYAAAMQEGMVLLKNGERCETPTAYTDYADPVIVTMPRSRADTVYNIQRWVQAPRGGHFAAMENPEFFAEDVRAWGATLPPL